MGTFHFIILKTLHFECEHSKLEHSQTISNIKKKKKKHPTEMFQENECFDYVIKDQISSSKHSITILTINILLLTLRCLKNVCPLL